MKSLVALRAAAELDGGACVRVAVEQLGHRDAHRHDADRVRIHLEHSEAYTRRLLHSDQPFNAQINKQTQTITLSQTSSET